MLPDPNPFTTTYPSVTPHSTLCLCHHWEKVCEHGGFTMWHAAQSWLISAGRFSAVMCTFQDPQDTLKEQCAQRKECVALQEELDRCTERVTSKTKTSETCAQELYDFIHCVDHCVRKLSKSDCLLLWEHTFLTRRIWNHKTAETSCGLPSLGLSKCWSEGYILSPRKQFASEIKRSFLFAGWTTVVQETKMMCFHSWIID